LALHDKGPGLYLCPFQAQPRCLSVLSGPEVHQGSKGDGGQPGAHVYHWTVTVGQLLCRMCSARVAASLGATSGGRPCWWMAQRGAAALKVSRRLRDGCRFGKQKWRAERRPVRIQSCGCCGAE